MTRWDSLPGRYGAINKRRQSVLHGLATFVIHGRLSGLNEYTSANRHSRFAGAKLKAHEEAHIRAAIDSADLPHFLGKVCVCFDWFESSRRRDFDNIASAKKFILDALQDAGVIDGDGWKHLCAPSPFTDRFFIDKDDPRIVVTIVTGDDQDTGMKWRVFGQISNTQQENA